MKHALLLVLAACDHQLDQRIAIVREPRVLAIVSEPPEAKPNASVTYTALVAGPEGPIVTPPHWALCTASKPPTEDNAVSTACIADDVIDLGVAATAIIAIPADACSRFGPDVPAGGFRPRDPDPTGGYYQPVRADVAIDLAFGFSRITCKLPNAPADVAHDYQVDYVANRNPTVVLDAPTIVAAGETITLTASWPADAVEAYLYYDPRSQTLVTRREAMRVSWFATGGALAVDASSVSETANKTMVTTTWRAPAIAGPTWIWIVLRDSRGGIATTSVATTIR